VSNCQTDKGSHRLSSYKKKLKTKI